MYSFVEAPSSSSTKVRVVTDTSARTETGVCLNDVIRDPPGKLQDLRGILLRSRAAEDLVVFDIRQFFRSVKLCTRDSMLRLMWLPVGGFKKAEGRGPVVFKVV